MLMTIRQLKRLIRESYGNTIPEGLAWIGPDGSVNPTHDHVHWARGNVLGQDFAGAATRVYAEMFGRGWARIAQMNDDWACIESFVPTKLPPVARNTILELLYATRPRIADYDVRSPYDGAITTVSGNWQSMSNYISTGRKPARSKTAEFR